MRRRPDLGQHGVAGLVAERVVDRLEVVEVEDRQRQQVAVAAGALDLAVQAGGEGAPVGEAGERVGVGQAVELGARLGVGDGDRRELGEGGQAPLLGRAEGVRRATTRRSARPTGARASTAARRCRCAGPASSTSRTDGSAGAAAVVVDARRPAPVRAVRPVAVAPVRVMTVVTAAPGAAGGWDATQVAAVLRLEAVDGAAAGVQQQRGLLRDDAADLLEVGLAGHDRGDPPQGRLLGLAVDPVGDVGARRG